MNLLISEPPQELIGLLTRSKKRNNLRKPDIPEKKSKFSDADIQDMLSFLNPDMSYDDWLKVGMAIHAEGYDSSLWEAWSKRGSKYSTGECQNKWNSFNGAAGVSLGTLVHMAQNYGWRPAQPFTESFKVNENPETKAQPLKIYHWSDLAQLPTRKYLIKGLFDVKGMSVIFGASNSGKTFLALDIAAHIALGLEWQGKRTRKGQVVYIAAEGGYGTQARLEAFRKHHDIEGYGELYVIPSSVLLCGEPNDLKLLLESLACLGTLDLVVIDTLARAMGGEDENLAKDMGSFIKNCDDIRETTGAHVMVIHHCGKNEERGARGSSALKGAIDTELQVSQDNRVISAKVTKQRDGKTGEITCFELRPYEVGQDEDGEALTSCALERTSAAPTRYGLTGQAQKTRQCLLNLIHEQGTDYVPKQGMASQKVVRLEAFKDHFIKAGIASTKKPDSLDKAFHRAKDKLKDGGYIEEWDGYVWILDNPDN
ncbi:MAG: AAA family ATPase [Alphaproteobacteria bacterium]|nr:AAA family ATPase [Alphaproteobacteria bacterium]